VGRNTTGDDCGWVDWVQWEGSVAEPDPNAWATLDYVEACPERSERDAVGRRIAKSCDGRLVLKYIYDGDHCIAEYGAGNDLHRKYVYGPCVDEPVCMVEAAGTYAGTYYYHFDGLGSVTALTNSSGNTVEVYEYDVYGRPGASVPAHPNRILFTGREYDQETGLYYYRARVYNPQIGRFLQTDPVGYRAGMNLYAYCGNSPILMADPSGLDPIPISVAFYNGSDPVYGQYFRNSADDMTYAFDMSECPADIPIDVWIERKLKGLRRKIGADAYSKIAGVYFMDHSNPQGDPAGCNELVTEMRFGNQWLDTDSQQMKDLCKTLNGSLPIATMIHFRCCSAGSDNPETMRRLNQIAQWACRPVTAARGHIWDLTTPDGGKTVGYKIGDPPYEYYEKDYSGRIVRNAPDYFSFWGYVIVTPESWQARCNNSAVSWEEAQKAQGTTRSMHADPVTGHLAYVY
jgi:RHS repeat-associated protein